MSVDPFVAKTGYPYLYGNGNPVTFSDPEGLEAGSWNNTSREYYVWQQYWKVTSADLKAGNERVKNACQLGCSQPASKKFVNAGNQQYQTFDSSEEVDHEYLDDSQDLLERRLAGQDTGVGKKKMEVNLLVSTWGWLQGGGIVQHENYECAEGVRCYPNHALAAGGDPEAVTIGNRIFCKTSCEELLDHELVHVEQYREDQLFAIKYLIEAARNGTCRANRYEAPAYAAGGNC